MKYSNKGAFLMLTFVATIFTSCYNDDMIQPTTEFEMYYLDSIGEKVIVNDTLNMSNLLFVNNLGEGGNYVFWPGDRIVNTKGLTFKMTDTSISDLQKSGVPDSVIQKAMSIKDMLYSTDKKFYGFLGIAIGQKNVENWGVNFMNASFIPKKDVNGKDSIQFTVNNNYDDYLHANEKGYYNVVGVPLSIASTNQYSVGYLYKTGGIHQATYTSIGIGDFGKTQTVVTKSFILTINY